MQKNQGFTLIEMIITIVIAAILLTVGIPSFFDMIQRNSVSSASNELVAALLYARSEAVRQEGNTIFTLDANGWTVDVDADLDGTVDATVLAYQIDNANISIAEDLDADTLTYNPRGRATASAGDSIEISYDGTLKSRVCINLIGRPSIKKVDEGDCP
ncbi:MAG: GspH/FimT family pseudopilin [Candidatus Thiodiazotropha sp. (ex. Lucinoma kazani)]